jgi:N-acetylmuramic acid 6-phosphate etherase
MKKSEPILLGIETGATKSVAIVATPALRELKRIEFGPANLRLISDKDFLRQLHELKSKIPSPTFIGIGLPGMRTEADSARVAKILNKAWPGVPARVTNDVDLILHAAELHEPASKHLAKVAVLSGTGSFCFGRSADGRSAKVGGWGHILGDKASGYDIALHACRAAIYYFDRDGEWGALGESILRQLCLNEPNELIDWIQSANKKDVAALAVAVFEAWAKKDRHAAEIIETAAHSLAADALKCASRLENSDAMVQFILAGSVLLKQLKFAELVAATIRQKRPQSVVTALQREAAWGAIYLAGSATPSGSAVIEDDSRGLRFAHPRLLSSSPPGMEVSFARDNQSLVTSAATIGLEKSPTELRNARSRNLDKLSARAAIDLFLSEEKYVQAGLKKVAPKIERALALVAGALKKGGRLFYVGAGTSGRLGVLDASECPPTFRTDPEMVQGIIAGGQTALWRSVEGAEDDPAAGARAIAFRNVAARDVIIGIAASGRTPFVWGALREAKKRRAKTILLTFNPNLQIPKTPKLDLLLAVDVGPELLTGSTRLKSGTATKLILNILTTLTMVRLGKVVSNLMVDLNPSNVKLRDRAIRIVSEISGASREQSQGALEQSGWVIPTALRSV